MSNDIRYGRKRSGIKEELSEKISDWINSIEDESLQKLIKKNTIVTGGSIASMLLGEPINDFDIYFKTKDCTIKVAEYYVNKLTDIRKEKNLSDLRMTVKEETILNIKGIYEDRVVIHIPSGGVASDSVEGEVKEIENKGKYLPVFISQNAITLSDKIQLVTRFYGDPEKIHSNYDFVHAMNYYDYSKNDLVLHPEALESLLSRTLIYKGSLYPIASIFRTKKFIERGWRISAGEQLKIMWQISEIDLTDINIIREQLTGVDQAYLYQLIEILEGSDKTEITSTYVSTIIDKIFN